MSQLQLLVYSIIYPLPQTPSVHPLQGFYLHRAIESLSFQGITNILKNTHPLTQRMCILLKC